MSSVLTNFFYAVAAAFLLAACSTRADVPVTSAALEPENVLTLGQPTPGPTAAPAPAVIAHAPVASPELVVAPSVSTAPVAVGAPAAVATPVAAVAEASPAAPTSPQDPSVTQNSYKLRARDFIRVLVINEPDTQIERRINSDGTIDIPFLKRLVPVAGLTLTQAQVELANQFRIYFKKPQVTISIVTYAERRVYVSGYVGRPGTVSIPPEETLTLGRALSMAGGILPRGNRSEVTIKRVRDGSNLVITKDVRRIDEGEEPDFVLEDEDQIYIRDRLI